MLYSKADIQATKIWSYFHFKRMYIQNSLRNVSWSTKTDRFTRILFISYFLLFLPLLLNSYQVTKKPIIINKNTSNAGINKLKGSFNFFSQKNA